MRLKPKRNDAKRINKFRNSKITFDEYRSPDKEDLPPYEPHHIDKRPKIHSNYNYHNKQKSSPSELHLYLHPNSYYPKYTYPVKKPTSTQSLNQQSYRHRFLNLNEPGHYNNYKYQDNSLSEYEYHNPPQRLGYFELPQVQNIFPFKRRPKIERQGAFIAATPLTYGAAWFGSMVGLAAIIRQPLSEVLINFNPWSLLNGMFLNTMINMDTH